MDRARVRPFHRNLVLQYIPPSLCGIKAIMLILSEKEVQNLIDIEELIAALEQAHIQYSTGKAVMPVRLVVPLNEIQGRITTMPGYLSRDQALGMKVVTYFQNNPARGLHAILASIMLFSAETGKMIAVMDGQLHYGHPHRLRVGHGDKGPGQSSNAHPWNSRCWRTGPGAHPRFEPRKTVEQDQDLLSVGNQRRKSQDRA